MHRDYQRKRNLSSQCLEMFGVSGRVAVTSVLAAGVARRLAGFWLSAWRHPAPGRLVVLSGAVPGARRLGLLALRSASGLGLPVRGVACPDSVQPGW